MEGVLAALQAGATELSDVGLDRSEWLSMVQMQQMVRVTCLEVMGAAPAKVDEFKAEVLKLQQLIQSYRDELLRRPPALSSPSTPQTVPDDSQSVGSPGPVLMLQPSFETPPKAVWFENRPFPPFTVRLALPSGADYPHDDVTLLLSLRNGRGQREELKASGEGQLLGGACLAAVCAGCATWESVRVCEPSSRHYGSFRIVISAAQTPATVGVAELISDPIAIQVGRMWSKRRKEELEPSDPVSQIPGIGTRYVSRLELHGVKTIEQFASLAATDEGRETLCRLCKGDNPRNSLNQQKLQAMIDKAIEVMRAGASIPKEKRKRNEDVAAESATSEARKASRLDGLQPIPSVEFSMEELLMLAGDEECLPPPPALPSSHGFAECEPDIESRTRLIALSEPKLRSGSEITIVPPKAGAVGMGAFDDADDSPPLGSSAAPPRSALLSAALVCVRFGCSPLHLAAASGNAALVERMLQRGAVLESKAPQLGGATPLMVAACCGPSAAAAGLSLLLAGASPDGAMAGQLHASHLAAWAGSVALLESLRSRGCASLRAASRSGLRAAHFAALGGQPAALELLLAADAADGGALPLLHAAAIGGDAACVALVLRAQPASLSARLRGSPPLHSAAAAGAAGAVGALLAARADARAADGDGLTALHLACAGGHADCAALLLPAQADSGSACRCPSSPPVVRPHSSASVCRGGADIAASVAYAVLSGDAECVQLLVGEEAAPDAAMLTQMAYDVHGEEGGAALAALLSGRQ
ncbi:hypothetical protein AB1Y20_013346 [Prymnesium parvum]|uniref:Uncharacterized protein n=1 Tax=Prymnesium parvum TaxID=97485 RepID=A0AB34IMJ6_PRYPA